MRTASLREKENLRQVNSYAQRRNCDENAKHIANQLQVISMHEPRTLLIHPSQIPPARQAYRPSDTDLKRARNILQLPENGVVAADGMMVDAPVITWAKRILATAAALGVDE